MSGYGEGWVDYHLIVLRLVSYGRKRLLSWTISRNYYLMWPSLRFVKILSVSETDSFYLLFMIQSIPSLQSIMSFVFSLNRLVFVSCLNLMSLRQFCIYYVVFSASGRRFACFLIFVLVIVTMSTFWVSSFVFLILHDDIDLFLFTWQSRSIIFAWNYRYVCPRWLYRFVFLYLVNADFFWLDGHFTFFKFLAMLPFNFFNLTILTSFLSPFSLI